MNAVRPPALREVRGPSAVGGGWRRFFDLLYLISVVEFKRVYFDTVLGYLWTLMRPLMLYAVLLAVFTQVFKLGQQIAHYPEILLLNIVLFGFFQEATMGAVHSIVGAEGIVRKTQFPRLVIPLSVVLTALFNLGLNLIVVFVFVLVSGIEPAWSWLAFPLIVAALFVLATAISMIVSALFPRFRDTAIIWGVFVASMFYATPIVYTLDPGGLVPATMRHIIILLNPLASILELARMSVIGEGATSPATLAGGGVYLIVPIAISVAICLSAVVIFSREAPRIAEAL